MKKLIVVLLIVFSSSYAMAHTEHQENSNWFGISFNSVEILKHGYELGENLLLLVEGRRTNWNEIAHDSIELVGHCANLDYYVGYSKWDSSTRYMASVGFNFWAFATQLLRQFKYLHNLNKDGSPARHPLMAGGLFLVGLYSLYGHANDAFTVYKEWSKGISLDSPSH